jgi:hypothetical protein
MFVQGFEHGTGVELRFTLHGGAPGDRAGIDEVILDVPSGRLFVGTNGDASADAIVYVPAASYRVRVTRGSTFDLWPLA